MKLLFKPVMKAKLGHEVRRQRNVRELEVQQHIRQEKRYKEWADAIKVV